MIVSAGSILSGGNNFGRSSALIPDIPISANPVKTFVTPVAGGCWCTLLVTTGEGGTYWSITFASSERSYFSRDPL